MCTDTHSIFLPSQDPNGTCAWSAMFSGRKKWILYPPHVLPPGVEIDTSSGGDGGFITTTSLVDWLLTYYPTIHDVPPSERPVECVTKAGELMFVPSGWWYRPRVNTFSKRASQLSAVYFLLQFILLWYSKGQTLSGIPLV